MDVKVKLLENVTFQAETRGHTVICDQPLTNNGRDNGMTPPELLLTSLGTCAAYYAVQYLRARQLPTEGLEVDVEAQKATQPARLGRFAIRVRVPDLDERHREGVLRAVKSCLIHATLEHKPEITIELGAPALV
jgi:putative redox protein